MNEHLVEAQDLTIKFRRKSSKLVVLKQEYFAAVDQVNFYIDQGETYGLVGESGSGKSTIGKAILRYHQPDSGHILFEGNDITSLKEKELEPYRRKMQAIFQDPFSSLDPTMTVSDSISEPLLIHHICSKQEAKEMAAKLLEDVGLQKNDQYKYPHEFSGGQRQRICIARALAIHPEFVVCDEPVSALDVSLQAQMIRLFESLQQEYGLTYLFISHQLQVVRRICDRIGVLYLGSLLEDGVAEKIYENPLHPYTKLLLSSMLEADPDVPSLDNITIDTGVQEYSGKGCKFANRCPYATQRCKEETPTLQEVEPGHRVACFQPNIL